MPVPIGVGPDAGLTRIASVEVELLRDRAELIVLPPPGPLTIAPIDVFHADAPAVTA
jgi:hypothetical protein